MHGINPASIQTWTYNIILFLVCLCLLLTPMHLLPCAGQVFECHRSFHHTFLQSQLPNILDCICFLIRSIKAVRLPPPKSALLLFSDLVLCTPGTTAFPRWLTERVKLTRMTLNLCQIDTSSVRRAGFMLFCKFWESLLVRRPQE